jgi:hypothetical protein
MNQTPASRLQKGKNQISHHPHVATWGRKPFRLCAAFLWRLKRGTVVLSGFQNAGADVFIRLDTPWAAVYICLNSLLVIAVKNYRGIFIYGGL